MVGQELTAKPDERKEALDYDKFSIEPKEKENKTNISDDLALVSYVPIEISSFLYYILKGTKIIQYMSKSLELLKM